MEITIYKRLYKKLKYKKQFNEHYNLLVQFIKCHENSWLINYLDWYDDEHCLFARKVFTALATMYGYEPDTFSGDRFLKEIYSNIEWNIHVDYEDFDLFMWSLLA